ncbi:MAG TPA: hypothetical protein VF395_05630 [Polyangiaceae bacterium]
MMFSEVLRDRAARAAKNQVLFRGANERVKELNEAFSFVAPLGEWMCECANTDCIERIEMSVVAYEAVRRHDARFFVSPSDRHFWPDVERVIEHNDGYWVVEGIGQPGGAAARDDARSSRRPLPLRT